MSVTCSKLIMICELWNSQENALSIVPLIKTLTLPNLLNSFYVENSDVKVKYFSV